MDIYESEKTALPKMHLRVETQRRPSALADKNNGATGRSRIREVSSRYMSPSPSASSSARRYPSPDAMRSYASSTVSVPKRAISAERKRPITPSRPSSPSLPSARSPSTPGKGSVAEALLATKKLAGNKLPEGLWPSTMRNVSVSFQSDTFSLPIGKREKPPPQALTDRTLRSSANITHKQVETSPGSRKTTSERKRSPLKGKTLVDQSENSRPLDSLNARLVEQNRWPTRAGGKLSPNALRRSIDLSDKTSRASPTSVGTGMPSIRRLSLDGTRKPLQKSSSDSLTLMSSIDSLRVGSAGRAFDDILIEKMSATRTKYLPSSVSSLQSPNSVSSLQSPKTASMPSSPLYRGVSPSRIKNISVPTSRGSSPSRVRPSSPSRQSSNSTSVLSYIVDIKKGKKDANHIEDAHQLRLLYNRHVQWRYANARAQDVLRFQKVKAEKILYNVRRYLFYWWDTLVTNWIELQQLRMKLKLYTILSEQLAYLDQWSLVESGHMSSLSLITQDLKDCTLRLPVAYGARGEIESVKPAVCSAVDIMQAMASSICSLLLPVERVYCRISELADVAAQQRAMLEECEAVLASVADLQVEEDSLRTNLIQLRQSLQLR